MLRRTNSAAASVIGFLLLASAAISLSSIARADDGPTKDSALKAEEELGQAMRTNDADGFCRLLDPDWAIVTGNGDIGGDAGTGKAICDAIRNGTFTRKTYEEDLAHARVRLYGDVATVTFNLSLSGGLNHEEFSVKEVQTDVLKWEDGAWKCVLTHETIVKGSLVIVNHS
jgi:ketosteroid isomerase-like protein